MAVSSMTMPQKTALTGIGIVNPVILSIMLLKELPHTEACTPNQPIQATARSRLIKNLAPL
jgi:hypothetical protein